MTFHFGTFFVQWAMVVHFVAVGTVVSGLMIHAYMVAVFPEERPAFYSMITGLVDELYAFRHHFKWWREVKILQRVEEEQDALAKIEKELQYVANSRGSTGLGQPVTAGRER